MCPVAATGIPQFTNFFKVANSSSSQPPGLSPECCSVN